MRKPLASIHRSASLREDISLCLSVLLNRGDLIARNFKGTFYSLKEAADRNKGNYRLMGAEFSHDF